MKIKNSVKVICSALFVSVIFALPVVAQDDEARQQTGLPTMVGNRPGSSSIPGASASLSGTLSVQGITDEKTSPTFTVVVSANGQIISRQNVRNRGSFSFNSLPDRNITLTVEADNIEVARYPLSQLNQPPLSNRQDILLMWLQVSQSMKQKNEVISIRNSYQRSEANQKLFDKAVEGLKDKKTDGSMKAFKQIVENDDQDFVAWTELGNLYFKGEKYSEADAAYNKAIALKPDFLPALINSGKLQIQQKNPDKAVEVLTKAVEAAPESADANHYLGEAFLLAKKGSKAVTYLNEAIRLAPTEKAELHLRLAALYNAAGLKDRAVAEYKLFLNKVPNHPEKAKIEKYISENSAAK